MTIPSQTCALPRFLEPDGVGERCLSSALVTETDRDVLVGGFFDEPSEGRHSSRDRVDGAAIFTTASQHMDSATDCVILSPVREIREDAVAQALELHEDTAPEAAWMEVTLLSNAVEHISMLSLEWRAALAHVVSVHPQQSLTSDRPAKGRSLRRATLRRTERGRILTLHLRLRQLLCPRTMWCTQPKFLESVDLTDGKDGLLGCKVAGAAARDLRGGRTCAGVGTSRRSLAVPLDHEALATTAIQKCRPGLDGALAKLPGPFRKWVRSPNTDEEAGWKDLQTCGQLSQRICALNPWRQYLSLFSLLHPTDEQSGQKPAP